MLENSSQIPTQFREDNQPEWWYNIPLAGSNNGKKISGVIEEIEGNRAMVRVALAPCQDGTIVQQLVEVIDHSGCIFNYDGAEVGLWCWAAEQKSDTIPECHWAALNICCVENCPQPTCDLDGVANSENNDATITWTTSTQPEPTTATLIIEETGEVISTLIGGPHTIIVTGGACWSFLLTVTNPCGEASCQWIPPPRSDDCQCRTCTYVVDGQPVDFPRPVPPNLCAPCGCQNGYGESVTLTVSGIPAYFDETPNLFFDYINNAGSGCTQSGCNEQITFREPRELGYVIEGFDKLNGTYVFNLQDNNCECDDGFQPGFRCRVPAQGFYLGEASITYKESPGRPLCHDLYTPPITHTIIVYLAASQNRPVGAGESTSWQPRSCEGQIGVAPLLWYRIKSSTIALPASIFTDRWHLLDPRDFGGFEFACEYTLTPTRSLIEFTTTDPCNRVVPPATFLPGLSGLREDPVIIGQIPRPGWVTSDFGGLQNLEQGLLPYFASITKTANVTPW